VRIESKITAVVSLPNYACLAIGFFTLYFLGLAGYTNIANQ